MQVIVLAVIMVEGLKGNGASAWRGDVLTQRSYGVKCLIGPLERSHLDVKGCVWRGRLR